MTDTPLAEVHDLVKQFPAGSGRAKVHAVEHVSLSIGRGETLAVVGESDCGKSTLAQLIIRLIEPTAGRIVLDGVDITKLSPQAMRGHRRKMQIIFRDPFTSLEPAGIDPCSPTRFRARSGVPTRAPNGSSYARSSPAISWLSSSPPSPHQPRRPS